MGTLAYSEPHKLSAGALALLVHGAFFALLFLGFSWQHQPPQGMTVDIWENLPQNETVAAAPPPEPLQEEAPVVTRPAAHSVPARADIEMPSRKKEKKSKEDNIDPVARLSPKQLAQQKAAYARRLKQEKAQQDAEAAREAAAQAAAQAQAAAIGKVVDEYKAKISAKIRRNIVAPPGVSKKISAEFDVTLLPGGQLLESALVLTRSSGNAAYDDAVERAILKSQPLPLPPDAELFGRFRNLHLKFSPE